MTHPGERTVLLFSLAFSGAVIIFSLPDLGKGRDSSVMWPLFVAGVTFILSAILLWRARKGTVSAGESGYKEKGGDSGGYTGTVWATIRKIDLEYRLFLWLIGLVLLLPFINYLLLAPLYVLLLLRFEGRVSWAQGILISAGVGIAHYLLFSVTLHMTLGAFP